MFCSKDLVPLAKAVKDAGKNIWCYTGFLYEDVMADKDMSALLRYVDVLVDGPYMESMRDIHLLFRGSSNQRLVDVGKSFPGAVVEWKW